MSSYTAEQYARLPKWAQHEIERLNRDIEWWHAKATVGPEESNTFVENPGLDEDDRPLGESPRIRFDIGSGSIEVRASGGYLLVSTNEALETQPVSSNVTRVRLGTWWK